MLKMVWVIWNLAIEAAAGVAYNNNQQTTADEIRKLKKE